MLNQSLHRNDIRVEISSGFLVIVFNFLILIVSIFTFKLVVGILLPCEAVVVIITAYCRVSVCSMNRDISLSKTGRSIST